MKYVFDKSTDDAAVFLMGISGVVTIATFAALMVMP